MIQIEVLESVKAFLNQMSAFLPKLIGALVILIVGWIIAKVVRSLAVKGLKLIRLDVLVEKSGIDEFLKQGGLQLTMQGLLAGLLYWLIMLIVLLAASNSLGLQVASDLFSKIVLYIPNVIVAVIVLILGAFFARLVKGILLTYLNNVGVEGAATISTLAQYAIIVFVTFTALEQLAIGRELIVSAFELAFGAVCLALALAFGLGGRDWATSIFENLRKKKDEKK